MTTKRNLVLVSLLLVFGLVAASPAFAQIAFSTSNNINSGVRAQGYTEATGTVKLVNTQTGTVGGTAPSGEVTEFDIYYTTAFEGLGSPQFTIVPGSVTITTAGGAVAGSYFLNNQTGFSAATPNCNLTTVLCTVLHVQVPQQSYATVNTASVSVTVRLDIADSGLYPNGGLVYGIAEAYTPIGVAYGFTINAQNANVGEVMQVRPDPALGVGFGTWSCRGDDAETCKVSSTAYVLLCLGVVHNEKQYERYFTLNVAEKFTAALTTSGYEQTLDLGTSPTPGNTEVVVVLSGIPANFGVTALGEGIPCSEVVSPGLPCPDTGTLAVGTPSPSSYWNSTGTNGGTATFAFPVTNMDIGAPENVNLPFKFYSAGPINSAGLPCVTAQVYKGPYNTTAVPRFKKVPENGPGSNLASQTPLQVICFNNCETNLLFPFVINIGAWDTDIAISNTTMDPLATIGANATPPDLLLEKGGATPQNGSCMLYYYSGGTLAATFPSGPIVSGSTWAADLGASALIPGGASGYLWANCNFSQAYGYAAINYSFTLNNGILADYLAVTIPDPEWSPRDMNGDGMGENAVTPVNVERTLLKELAGFSSDSGCCTAP